MSQELQVYIAQARKDGRSDESIVKDLIDRGWSMSKINSILYNQSEKSDKTQIAEKFKTQQLVFVILSILFYIVVYFVLRYTIFSFSLSTTDTDIRNLQLVFGLPILFLILTMTSILTKSNPSPFGFLNNKSLRRLLNIVGWAIVLLPFLIMIYAMLKEFVSDYFLK